MPSAGGIIAPTITPLRKPGSGITSSHIDTSTLLIIETEARDCNIYFTTDGSKPMPFQRKIGGKEITFKYVAPFGLRSGKRCIKAIAVSNCGRERLHLPAHGNDFIESAIVTKTYQVDDVESSMDDEYSSFFETDTDSTLKSRSVQFTSTSESDTSHSKQKSRTLRSRSRSKSPKRRLKTTAPREAWASNGVHDNNSSGAFNGVPASGPQMPEGPCNPTNYSGTQINVWGTPGGVSNGTGGALLIGQPTQPASPYPVQYGYLTENMIGNLNPGGDRPVTVGDMKNLLDKGLAKTPRVERPAIEYKQAYDDPPLKPFSPANGDYKEQLLHVYAHMLEHCKSHGDFRLSVAQPKMGKMLEGKFTDEGDGYKLTVVMAKPGVPRGSVKKTPIVRPPVRKPVKKEEIKEEKPKPVVKPVVKKKVPVKKDPYFEMETENLNQKGTVVPYEKFNAEQDAEVLKSAMKGLGTDEDMIINVLAYRSNTQRQEICLTYKTMFGKDLIKALESELSKSFLDTCKALCMAPAEYDAYLLRKAIKGLGTDEDVLIEILCTRSNAQIKAIIDTYKQKYNKSLEKDIISDTSGNFKRLLVGLLQANRSDSREVDRNKANQDAKAMYEAGEGQWGTDESRFNVVLVSRSYPQLRATFEEYSKISKKSMEEALKSEFSGDILKGMKTIVRCVQNKFGHFARELQKTMKGMGTDDDTLVRVVVTRCEIDMVQIKEEFETLTGQTLEQYISDDISGDYRNIILSLVTGGPPPTVAAKSGKAFVEATKMKTEEELDEEVKMESEPVQEDPTCTPAENFNAEADCEVLKKAMKGFGTDEKSIIECLCYRSTEQRVEIVKSYKTMFGKDLIKELKSETSGNFKTLLEGLCMCSADFDATQIKKAVKGLGTDEKVLVEVICTRTNEQIKAFKEAYKTLFNKELEADVSSDTSGAFRKLLVGLLQANREESQEFDRNKAKQDAQALLDAGEKKWGTDESRFNAILVSRSYPQLRATFQEYAKLANKDIDDTIQSEMSSDLKEGMLAIVRCIRSKSTHFAAELHRSMRGLGTDDDTLVRVVVSRSGVDMVQIKEEFQKNYKQTLGMFIKDDTSGDYRTALLALVREEGVGKKK